MDEYRSSLYPKSSLSGKFDQPGRRAMQPQTEPSNSLRLLAIVPAYNEGEMVAKVIREINRVAPDFDVVVVDDGSVDDTVAEAQARERRCSAIRSTSGSAARCSRATSTR